MSIKSQHIIRKSLLEVFWPINIGTLINYFVDGLTIVGVLANFKFMNTIPNNWKWVVATGVIICIFIGRFLFFLNKNINSRIVELEQQVADKNINLKNIRIAELEQQVADKNIWCEAVVSLRKAYSKINLLHKEEYDKNLFMDSLINFCDILQKFYNKKTNSSCCVSIKVAKYEVYIDNKNTNRDKLDSLSFVNLCRDSHHPTRDNDIYKNTNHNVTGNTAYSTIIGRMFDDNYEKIFYINNDVKNTPNYLTTSRNGYDNNEIPYESELVYPIIPHIRPNTKYVMVGFICVDCKDKNKFQEKNDLELSMISCLADGLYNILISYLKDKQWNKQN